MVMICNGNDDERDDDEDVDYENGKIIYYDDNDVIVTINKRLRVPPSSFLPPHSLTSPL
jgi:hypothetical protein